MSDRIRFMAKCSADGSPTFTGNSPALFATDARYYVQGKQVELDYLGELEALSAANDDALADDELYSWVPRELIDRGPVIPIGEGEFRDMLRRCREVWRLEYGRDPAPDEMRQFDAYMAGKPPTPHQWTEWGEWLEFTSSLGNKITRTLLIDDPATDYQQWRIWAIPYHGKQGEQIHPMSLSEARNLGIVPGNGWLFDGERLVLCDNGGFWLSTSEDKTTMYRGMRNLAMPRVYAG